MQHVAFTKLDLHINRQRASVDGYHKRLLDDTVAEDALTDATKGM